MTIRPLRSGEPEDLAADLCIVGGGMAGLLLAARLCATRRVVVLESGPASGAPLDALNAVEDVGGRYATAQTGRIRALGGASTVWGGRLLPITAADMAMTYRCVPAPSDSAPPISAARVLTSPSQQQ